MLEHLAKSLAENSKAGAHLENWADHSEEMAGLVPSFSLASVLEITGEPNVIYPNSIS